MSKLSEQTTVQARVLADAQEIGWSLVTKAEILAVLRSIPTRTTLHLKRSLLESVISEVESNS
jgi:hypothetical protein